MGPETHSDSLPPVAISLTELAPFDALQPGVLYETLADRLAGFARWVSGDGEVAEAAVQQAFVELARRTQPPREPGLWLLRRVMVAALPSAERRRGEPTPLQRAALHLRHVEHLGGADLARVLGRSRPLTALIAALGERRLRGRAPLLDSEIPELIERLHPGHQIPEASRRVHRQAIASARPTRRQRRGGSRSFLAVGLAVFALWGLGDGLSSALPGDGFYPAKRAVEPVWAVVDDDVVARHRLDEVTLLALGGASPATLMPALDEARAAVAELEPTHPLRAQLIGVETWLAPVVAQASGDDVS